MTRNVLLTDLGLAVLAAGLVLILTPGVAVAGLIAILVLVGCAISFVIDSRRRRGLPPLRRRRRGAQTPRRRPRTR